MTSIRHRLLVLLLGSWTTVWLAVAVITIERSGMRSRSSSMRSWRRLPVWCVRSLTPAICPTGTVCLRSSRRWITPTKARSAFSSGAGNAHQLLWWCTGGAAGRDAGIFRPRHRGHEMAGLRPGYGSARRDPVRGQSYAIRHELVEFLTIHALQPILWSLPLTAMLIWFSVSDGLRPLSRLAGDIGRRSAERLRPIDQSTVPTEIRPLINALNGLMGQLDQALSAERHFASDVSHSCAHRWPSSGPMPRSLSAVRIRPSRPRPWRRHLGCRPGGPSLLPASRAARLDPEAADSMHRRVSGRCGGSGGRGQAGRCVREAVSVTDALPQGDPCVVAVDPSALGVLVSNLLDNAIKYTPEGGRVRIAMSRVAVSSCKWGFRARYPSGGPRAGTGALLPP